MNENIDVRLLQRQLSELKAENDTFRRGGHNGGGPPRGDDVEARVGRLESDVEYIKRDIGELKTDLKKLADDVTSIKHRQAYLAGAGFVIVLVAGWIANNRFDQIMALLTK